MQTQAVTYTMLVTETKIWFTQIAILLETSKTDHSNMESYKPQRSTYYFLEDS